MGILDLTERFKKWKSKTDLSDFSLRFLFGEICGVCHGSGREKKTIPCNFCHGEKEDYLEAACQKCHGLGKELDIFLDWKSFHAISAIFTVFFQLMGFGQDADKIVSAKTPQLLMVQTCTAKEMHGGSIDGTYGIPLVNWLAKKSDGTNLTPVSWAMQLAHKRIFGTLDRYDSMYIYATIGSCNGWLNISCPGDRTGLHPAHGGISIGNGYEFYCHNVDTPMQQLTLLAALAALCDMARKEME